MKPIRVMVVGYQGLFREALISLLHDVPEFQVIGQAVPDPEAVELAEYQQPDIVLMEARTHDVRESEFIARLLACDPPPGVVVISASRETRDMLVAIRAGARGHVLNDADAGTLFRVIREVHAGGDALCRTSTRNLLELVRKLIAAPVPVLDPVLTPREQEVLALMAAGAGNAQIATSLVISENTVRTHVSHILDKLGVHSRQDLLANRLPKVTQD